MLQSPDKQLELYTPDDVDEFVDRSADVVSQLHTQTTRNILEIGQRLAAVKALLGHGKFGIWVSTKCSFSTRTATRYMSAAKTFDSKSDSVSEISVSVVAPSPTKASVGKRATLPVNVVKGTPTAAGEINAHLAAEVQSVEAVPEPPPPVDRRGRHVAVARTKLAKMIIAAASDSIETALDLTQKAMLPELQATLVEIKSSRAEKQAEFDARQLALPFVPPP